MHNNAQALTSVDEWQIMDTILCNIIIPVGNIVSICNSSISNIINQSFMIDVYNIIDMGSNEYFYIMIIEYMIEILFFIGYHH